MARNNDREAGGAPAEAYLEFTTIGRQVRVSAIDARTGVEVVVFGPATTSRADFERLAMRKLQRRLEQEK